MEAQDSSTTKYSGGIPYFFYDVIGRILPGAVLILGSLLVMKGRAPFESAWDATIGMGKVETGAATLILGFGTLIFVGVSSLVGTATASIAYETMRLLKIEKLLGGYSKRELETFLGLDNSDKLEAYFRDQFGSGIPSESGQIERASQVCAYHLFKANPAIAIMSARHDAEALNARAMLFVSALLLVGTLYRTCQESTHAVSPWWLIIPLVSFLGFVLTFNYHRKKRVYGRFALYLVSQ